MSAGRSPATMISAVVSDGDGTLVRKSGLSIAMGNASPRVQGAGRFRDGSNSDEGFARAMERFILARPSAVPRASR
jgi:hydroxymethylpyrimidine pyrophosphatase-like HAD family hydrolase